MATSQDLVIDSVTGVEVALPVAGPGARAYAFVLDWHIRAALFVAWYVIAAMLYNGRFSILAPVDPPASWFLLVVGPSTGIYLLYHLVLEVAMHGRTPGKRIAGVRLATRTGGVPSVGALLTRNIFRLVDSFPLFYGVGLVATIITRDHVRIGDMAAGTLLVYDRGTARLPEDAGVPISSGLLDTGTAELISELLGRWDSLAVEARSRLARTMLERLAARGVQVPSDTSTDAGLRQALERLTRGASS